MPMEKMSKGKGNVVTPDEVIYAVADLSSVFEFRDDRGDVIHDYKSAGVWQDSGDGMYYGPIRAGKPPVFLHEKDNPVPGMLNIKGSEILQHPQCLEYWAYLIDLYWDDSMEGE